MCIWCDAVGKSCRSFRLCVLYIFFAILHGIPVCIWFDALCHVCVFFDVHVPLLGVFDVRYIVCFPYFPCVFDRTLYTGWRGNKASLELQVIFRKRATNHRALLRKTTWRAAARRTAPTLPRAIMVGPNAYRKKCGGLSGGLSINRGWFMYRGFI